MKRIDGSRVRARGLYLAGVAVLSMTALPLTTAADAGVAAGFFRGSEMKTTTIGVTCFPDTGQAYLYRVLPGVTASASGAYGFSNVGHHYAGNSQIAFYTSFDPADPTANRVGWSNIDTLYDEGPIPLEAGVEYTVVVQSFNCDGPAAKRGEWSFTYRGPGALSGPSFYPLPSYGSGTVDATSPTFMSPACGIARYQSAGPVRVPVSGEYRYSDAAVHFDLDIELLIYEGSFNPNSPNANLLTIVDDGATLELEEGTDYYLVAHPWGCGTTFFGNYEYVLLGPSGEFVITEGVNGAWANFDTLGQGQLMEVYPDINLLFSAWFTWDTTQPDAGETANVGDPNHRWLTAQGGYEGDTATLVLYTASGGLFDDPAPVQNPASGTMSIRFLSCNEAEVTYELGDRSGSYTMNKIANDNVATCDMLRNQHKVPVE